MHIYDFIGLPQLHKTRGTDVFQLVLREDKVNPKNAPEFFDCSVKIDGIFTVAVHNGKELRLFGRSGKELQNIALLDIPYYVRDAAANAPFVCFQYELKSDKLRQSVFNGIVSPNRKKPAPPELEEDMGRCTFWPIDFFDLSKTRGTIRKHDRIKMMKDIMGLGRWMPAHRYGLTFEQFLAWSKELIALGEEGACAANPDGVYEPGCRRADLVIKKARDIHIDLRCVAIEEGEGKHKGIASKLTFKWTEGKFIKASLGEGWDYDKMRHLYQNQEEAIGHIFHVYAFDRSELGVLRQPKVAERRDDKTICDVEAGLV